MKRRYFVWLLTLGIVCGTAPGRAALALGQTSTESTAGKASTSSKTGSAGSHSRKKNSTSSRKRRKRRPASARVQKVHRAFVASTSLRPMAQQLLQDRTPAAYAGVEAYARRHANDSAGSLAWLVVGYAHTLDHDFAKAIDPLSRAKANSGELGEYVTLHLANAYLQTGHVAEASAAISGFADKYPDSLLIRDAHVLYANTLLSQGKANDAIAILEKDRQPVRADLELALGRAYEAAGDNAKAASILRNIYYNMPASYEADPAGAELKKLSMLNASVPERKTRADLLLKGKRYSDAATEYRSLLNDVNPAERPTVQMVLAVSLEKSGQGREARQVLAAMPETTSDANAQRLHMLGEIAKSSGDENTFLQNLDQLRHAYPNSPWLEQSLLSAGNMYLLHKDYDKAIDAYRELQQRFPQGRRASYAHWKAAWLSLRQARTEEAKKEFEDQIALYPSSAEVPAALYWRGRLAEEDGDLVKARSFYVKLSERFHNYYYAELARQRMKSLKSLAEPVHYAILDRIPALPAGKVFDNDAPTDNLRYQKAQLLANGALVDLAVRELQAAAAEEEGSWAAPEAARIYQDSGRYDRAIESMKHAVPNYFAMEIPQLPTSYWQVLFPKPYWTDLKRYSEQNALDPYLVASLIRQESEFNPNAISHMNAWGLMQLLPKTGKAVAKQVKLKHFNTNQLLTPSINLELGTRYFRGMVDRFGSFEYALAAYNAGDDRVKDWLADGKYRDPQEFVESIPFTETREYVQAILRNANVYRQLYGTP